MRSRHPTPDELRRIFDVELAAARAGGGLRTDTGLDPETDDALVAIAMAHPDIPAALVTAARHAFAAQLDGSNAAARRAHLADLARNHNRDNG